jgi:hypothetical protein
LEKFGEANIELSLPKLNETKTAKDALTPKEKDDD